MADTGIQYIDVEEFTKNARIEESNSYFPVIGEGIFDKLMETATKHLTAQYKANRIRKEDYADLYAHIYEVTLQSALMAWLQKPEQAAKVELLNAQTEHEYIKIDQTKEQTKLIIEQQALTHSQKAHEDSKKLNTEANTVLLGEQAAHEISKRLNTEQNTRLLIEQTALMHEQTLHETSKRLNTEEQTILIREQEALIHAQALHEASRKLNTEADTILKESQSINVRSDTELKEKQAKSVAVEPLVKLAQTEYLKAQTKAADKDEQVKEAQAVSEHMKANLYKRQIEGFDEDFKQKLLKIGLDSWAVGFSVAQDVMVAENKTIPTAMTAAALDALWANAIAPDVDVNTYDSRNVTFDTTKNSTETSNLKKQEPDFDTTPPKSTNDDDDNDDDSNP